MPDTLEFRRRPAPRDCGVIEVEATDEVVTVRFHPRHLDDPVARAAVASGDAMLIEVPMILVVESFVRARA